MTFTKKNIQNVFHLFDLRVSFVVKTKSKVDPDMKTKKGVSNMTQMGLNYLVHLENSRHNRRGEEIETGKLSETARHNRRTEEQQDVNLAENERSHRAGEANTRLNISVAADKLRNDYAIAAMNNSTKEQIAKADREARQDIANRDRALNYDKLVESKHQFDVNTLSSADQAVIGKSRLGGGVLDSYAAGINRVLDRLVPSFSVKGTLK